jgi:sugar phosphate permease
MRFLTDALARRAPFYYGWVVTAVVGLAIFPTVAYRPAIIGLLYPSMQETFGWSRSSLGGAVFLGSALVIVAAPLAGRLADRYGAWLVLNAATVLMGLCLIGLGAVSKLWMFYLLFGVGYATFAGVNRVAITSAMAQWFVRRRGTAMGFVTLMLGLGFIVIPLLAERVLDGSGWSAAWYVLGFLMLAVALPGGVLLYRNRPADVGQAPDGRTPSDTVAVAVADQGAATAASEVQWTAREAARTRTLWMLVASISLLEMSRNGIGIHMIAHMTEQGMSPTFAAASFSIAGVTMVPMSVSLGLFVDAVGARAAYGVAALSVLIMGVLVIFTSSNAMAIPIGITMGIGAGGVDMIMRIIFANYFGRASAGTVMGIVTPFIVVSLGLGALISGVMYDIQGSYVPVFWSWIAVEALAIVILLFVPPPRARASTADGELAAQPAA